MAGQQAYNIGQIIYILSNKSQSVVPAIVAEEDTRKVRKLDGVHEVVNYKLHIGPKDRQKTVDLSRIDGEVFNSLEDIRATLVERLTQFVEELVKTTTGQVKNWYGITADNQILDNQVQSLDQSSGDKFDPAQIIDAVNNNTPLQQQQQQMGGMMQQQQQAQLNPHASIRDNIRNMVEPEHDMVDNGMPQTIILPDGSRVPFRSS